jgi:hypothetical protein
MPEQASVNKEWAVRMLLIGVLFTAYGSWCIYDGAIAYPEMIDKYELTHPPATEDEPRPNAYENWPELLREAGYEVEAGDQPPRAKSDSDIMTQWIQAALCFPIGFLILIHWAYHARRVPRADEQGLHFGGKTVPYSDIQEIDKTRWFNKDICIVSYDGTAGSGRYNLDGWKYKGAHRILEIIEERAPQAEIKLKHEDAPTA